MPSDIIMPNAGACGGRSAYLGSFRALPRVGSEVIDGPVLISADELSGYLSGPGPLNPYGDFQKVRPTAVIGGGVLVYDGRFSVPRLSALTRRPTINRMLVADPKAGLAAPREIAALDPDNVDSWTALARAFLANGQRTEARAALDRALHVARTVQPEFVSFRQGCVTTANPPC